MQLTRQQWSRLLKWCARGVFGVAVALLAFTLWNRRGAARNERPEPHARKQYAPLAWDTAKRVEWRWDEHGLSVTHREDWKPDWLVSRLTEAPLQDAQRNRVAMRRDLVTWRFGKPRAVVSLQSYEVPQPLSWEEWQRRFHEEPTLRLEFGSEILKERSVKVGDRPALEIEAQGAIEYPTRGEKPPPELWFFRSRFVAEGRLAYKITAAAPSASHEAVQSVLNGMLESFRWSPPDPPAH